MGKKRPRKQKEKIEEVSIKEFLDAQQELEELERQYGIEHEEKGAKRLISKFFDGRENRPKRKVQKKKYMIVMILLGWCGGHRFMAHRWVLAAIYLGLFWSGFPMAMTLIDILEVIPMPADEDGCIMV